jgi:hypothetical protein
MMRRPRDVTLISLVILLAAIAKLLAAAASFNPIPPGTPAGQLWLAVQRVIASELRYDLLTVAVLIALGLFEGLSAIGMFGMRSWAWLMAMVVQGAYLAIELARYPGDGQLPGGMALAVVVVFYLNQRHIRRAFRVAMRQADPAGMLSARATHAELEEDVTP